MVAHMCDHLGNGTPCAGGGDRQHTQQPHPHQERHRT